MGNPYHDEQGLFTSKEKMGQMIADLRTEAISAPTVEERNAAMDKLLPLQVEYDNLTADKVSVSKEWLTKAANSGMMFVPQDVTTMQAYYDGIREQMTVATEDHGDSRVLASKAAELLKRPNLPEDIREDIYANASDAVKAELVREMGLRTSGNHFTGADVMKLVPKDGPIGPALGREIAGITGTNAFTFEQRFDIAKRSGSIPYLISYGTPSAVFESRESEDALVDELYQVSTFKSADTEFTEEELDKAMTQRRGWAAAASRVRNPKTQALILDLYGTGDDLSDRHVQANPYNNPAATLLRENEHLDQKTVNQLFKKLAKDDVVTFDKLADAYIKSNADTSLAYVMKRQNTLMDALPNRYYTAPDAAETAELQMTVTSMHSTPTQRVNAQAKLDAIPANLKALHREFNQLKKSMRRGRGEVPEQDNARYSELYTRTLNAARAAFANKTMNYWQSEYPQAATKS
jgi:hypothetical protein